MHVCGECGEASAKWQGRCPGCGAWGSLQEEPDPRGGGWGRAGAGAPGRRTGASGTTPDGPLRLGEVEAPAAGRCSTGLVELDRVLGGGLVAGGVVLVGGDPGIGKSTLLLQVADRLSRGGRPSLYVTGEESAYQVRLRAERLGVEAPDLYLLAETALERILAHAEGLAPSVLVVDSIQMVGTSGLPSAPGTVGQVRECAALLVGFAKRTGVPVVLIGHVTKDGSIAGPRVLEHVVDCVLYFEGERYSAYRLLRTVKNRFGPATELGVFRMAPEGLVEVPNPSEVFLTGDGTPRSGAAVAGALEGSRAFLVEVQALVADSAAGSPARRVTGVDPARVAMVLAVLERRVGLALADREVFVNAVGGARLTEPAADLAIAAAVASSHRDRPLPPGVVLVGEVGLGGELRRGDRLEARLVEAARLGFARAVVPRPGSEGLEVKGLALETASGLAEALEALGV